MTRVEKRCAARSREKLRAETEQPPCRGLETHDAAARVAGTHVHHRALAGSQSLGDRSNVFVGHIDHAFLHRFVSGRADLAGENLWPADFELIAFAPHRFDQNRELQFTATGHLQDVGRPGVLHRN